LWLLAACTLAALAGCWRVEPIRTYTVPKQVRPAARQVPEVDRMLAAYVASGDRAWFFKLVGPKEPVAALEEDFRKLVESVRFDPAGKASWKLPSGWTQLPGDGELRVATLVVSGDEPPEVTVVTLTGYTNVAPQEFALNNLNRWRGQMQLDPIDYVDLNDAIEEFNVDGKPAVLANLAGEFKSSSPPFAAMGHADSQFPAVGPAERPGAPIGPAPPPVAAASDPTYELPQGWRTASNDTVSSLAFEVVDGDESVRITVSSVGGDMLANVNRWRGQLGLGRVTPEQLAASLKRIEVAGTQAEYIALVGPETADPRETILAAAASVRGVPWVIRLKGDWQLAERERTRFEAFVTSLRFQ
jgi:hypothetical protein